MAPGARTQQKAARKGAAASSPCQDVWAKVWRTELELQAGKVIKKPKLRARAKALQSCPDDGSVAFAMAQALVWSRVAQGRGMGGLPAFRRAEGWASKAYARDPEFRAGLPRRVLGSMWALGGQHLEGKDSEQGLEQLMDQVNRYPVEPENVLRLVEALCALGDLEGGHEVYCIYSSRPKAWVTLSAESKGLLAEVESLFGAEQLVCPQSSLSSR